MSHAFDQPFTALPRGQLGDCFAEPFVREKIPDQAWHTRSSGGGLDWPPGTAGEIARFIFGAAHRPVKEVAIVATLGWLGGVCARAYEFEHDGPNLYVLLLALSGIGKEHLHGGIHILMTALVKDQGELTLAPRFIESSEIASGPALAKACAENPSFLLLASEFGRTLKLLGRGKDSNVATFATQLTKLYSKSGVGGVAGGIRYSNRENNVTTAHRIALSFVGESTPETFYEAVDSDMLEDGFLSRFTVVEYAGERPARNKARDMNPPAALVQVLRQLLLQALKLNAKEETQPVTCSAEAAALLDAFDAECDSRINANPPTYRRQMLNRAHLKVQRVSALLAVADNHITPCIEAAHVRWALDLVQRDMKMQTAKHEAGDVGKNDDARERKLGQWMKEYMKNGLPKGYGIPDAMHRDGVVPRKYFHMRAQSTPAFAKHPFGTIRALDDALRSLCDTGYLLEVGKLKAADSYCYAGRCYRIVNLHDNSLA